MDTNFYIYRHIRKDTMTPFYIGKGKNKRAWCKNRNRYWKNIANKHGYIVEIIMKNLTEKQAFAKEIEFIKLYKSCGYCEANMCKGGEGRTCPMHPNTRKALLKAVMGRTVSDKTREKIRNSNKGKSVSIETREKISKAKKGKASPRKNAKLSSETKIKIGNANKGNKHSSDAKKRMSISKSGKNNYKAKKIMCIKTKKIWHCVKDAANELNINRSTLTQYLNGNRENKTTLKYLL